MKGGIFMADNLHAGHRKRVREEFLKNGMNENTPKHKALEHLLFYGIPRADTNEIAHRLIKHFGSFSAVFDATPEELQEVDGIGENTAALIKLIMPLARLYMHDKAKNKKVFQTRDKLCDFIIEKYAGITTERISLLMLSSTGKILGFEMIGEGDVNGVAVSVRKIAETVFKYKADAVIIAHNHPFGNAMPSDEDLETTKELVAALRGVGILLVDHIIVADNDGISLYQSNKYRYVFK